MGSIPSPDVAQWQLSEYRQAAEIQNQRDQLAQNQAVNQQNIAASQQQMQQQAELQPGQVQAQKNQLAQQKYEAEQRDKTIAASQAAYDPDKKTWDPDRFATEAGKSGVHPQSIAAMQAALTKAASDKATLTKDQLANDQAELGQQFQHVESLRGLLDKDAPNNMIQGEGVNTGYQKIMMDTARTKGPKAIENWPTQVRTKDQIDALESQLGMQKYINDQAEQKAKTQHELSQSTAAQLQNEYEQLDTQDRLSKQKDPNTGEPLAAPLSPQQAARKASYEHVKTDLSPSLNPIVLNYKAKADERADVASDRKDTDFIDKNYVKPANDKEQSYQMFQEAYDNRNNAKTGAESMLALSTHLATTFGNVKGARVTKDMIEHHLGARGVGDSALVAVQKLTNGDVLSPDQWDAFKSLITNARNLNWQTAKKEADRRGVDISGSLPADLAGSSNKPTQDFFTQFGGKKR